MRHGALTWSRIRKHFEPGVSLKAAELVALTELPPDTVYQQLHRAVERGELARERFGHYRLAALVLLLLLLACGRAELPPVGSDCGCVNRGLVLSEDGRRIDRICQRVTHLNPDGGVEWPDCSPAGSVCCAWGKP